MFNYIYINLPQWEDKETRKKDREITRERDSSAVIKGIKVTYRDSALILMTANNKTF